MSSVAGFTGDPFRPKSPTRASAAADTASMIVTDTVSGSHLLKIAGHSLNRGIGIGNCITSSAFIIGGHSWVIHYYPDGYAANDDEYISFYLMLLSEVAEVKARFKINLLKQRGNVLSIYEFDEARTFDRQNTTWGYRRFIKRSALEVLEYLEDDCFTVRCDIEVINAPRTEVIKMHSVTVPTSDLGRHLGGLLMSGDGADVVFEVHGETFAAHKWMLAARSPVFKAELFGKMKEESVMCVKIEDMEADVFKALLHLIYTDSLLDVEELNGFATKKTSTMMAQHLLVAADRYGLDRLRSICEDKLCKEMDVSMVATTLALAEQHHCDQLKVACLEFLAAPERLKVALVSEGFEHLTLSCPSILKELIANLGGL